MSPRSQKSKILLKSHHQLKRAHLKNSLSEIESIRSESPDNQSPFEEKVVNDNVFEEIKVNAIGLTLDDEDMRLESLQSLAE